MKVSNEEWQLKLDNLNSRRKYEVIKNDFAEVDDYESHINKCYIGKTILDVGCGLQLIKQFVPNSLYVGLDPTQMISTSIPMTIEECNFAENSFETIYCFATLDGLRDLQLAAKQMKKIASKNIVILNGIDIKPDQYHTHNITIQTLTDMFGDWKIGTKEFITYKVLLIEYLKNES